MPHIGFLLHTRLVGGARDYVGQILSFNATAYQHRSGCGGNSWQSAVGGSGAGPGVESRYAR